jgi:hypothetical protein
MSKDQMLVIGSDLASLRTVRATAGLVLCRVFNVVCEIVLVGGTCRAPHPTMPLRGMLPESPGEYLDGSASLKGTRTPRVVRGDVVDALWGGEVAALAVCKQVNAAKVVPERTGRADLLARPNGARVVLVSNVLDGLAVAP